MCDLQTHGDLVVESQRCMKLERSGDSGKAILQRRLEADTCGTPQPVLGLLHVSVKVAEVDDARLVHFVEVDPAVKGILADGVRIPHHSFAFFAALRDISSASRSSLQPLRDLQIDARRLTVAERDGTSSFAQLVLELGCELPSLFDPFERRYRVAPTGESLRRKSSRLIRSDDPDVAVRREP